MTDDDITPDRLRLAGWDDRFGVFTRDGREDVFRVQRPAGTWLWFGRDGDPALLTGMADVAARLAAASRDPEGDGKNGFKADAVRAKSQGGD